MRLITAVGSTLILGWCGLLLLACLWIVALLGGLDWLKPERD